MGSIFGNAPARPKVRQRTSPRGPFVIPRTEVKPEDDDNNVITPKKHPRQHEENLQFRVVNYVLKQYPQAIIVTDHAGLDLTKAQRQKMMRMRSEKGHPDISIDFPSRGYHGLRIELKKEGTVIYKKDGSLRKQNYRREYIGKGGRKVVHTGDHLAEQAATLKKYNDLGYFARFGVGYDNCVKLIDWYFQNNATLF